MQELPNKFTEEDADRLDGLSDCQYNSASEQGGFFKHQEEIDELIKKKEAWKIYCQD